MEKGKIFGHPGLVLRGPETHAPDFVMFDMNGQVLHVDTRPFTREVRRQAGMAYEDGIGGFRLVLRDGRAYPICTIEYGAYRERNGSPSKYAGWIATMANVVIILLYAMREREDRSLELLIGRVHNPRRASTDPNDSGKEAPRGRIEGGEMPLKAGRRELLEEVGFDCYLRPLPGKPLIMNNAWLSHEPLPDGSPGGVFGGCYEVNVARLEPVNGDPNELSFGEDERVALAAARKLEAFEEEMGGMTFEPYRTVIDDADAFTSVMAPRLKQWLEDKGWVFDLPGVVRRA